MQHDFTDRRVIVTGAAQGIGRAIVARFAEAGAHVHAFDRDEAGLRGAGAAGMSVLDLSDRAAVQAAVAAVGPVDILVTAAGGVRGQGPKPIEEVDEQAWHQLFQANADSAFWCAQAVVPAMKAQRRGRIVTISSGAGLRPSLTGIQAYAAAKHALVGLTRQLSWELGPHGITVNSVAPGFVLSNPATERQWQGYGPEGQAKLVESIHTRRLGTADEIAHAALFLASDQASWISGQVLSVDGGRS
jgi:3-oxoacyl-[acyl-carrier protein] reductase